MPKMDVHIGYDFGSGNRASINRTIEVSEHESEQLTHSTGPKTGDWPYVKEAEILIWSLLKKELFPNQAPSIQRLEDLRWHGVKFLYYTFTDERGNSMGSQVIYSD